MYSQLEMEEPKIIVFSNCFIILEHAYYTSWLLMSTCYFVQNDRSGGVTVSLMVILLNHCLSLLVSVIP